MSRLHTRLQLPLLLLALAAPAQAADVTVTLPAGDAFVVEDSTTPTPIERLGVEEATGNISRNGSLFIHTTGANSVFVGQGAGGTSTTGGLNAAFGTSAFDANMGGDENSAFGANALGANTEGGTNSAFGTACGITPPATAMQRSA